MPGQASICPPSPKPGPPSPAASTVAVR